MLSSSRSMSRLWTPWSKRSWNNGELRDSLSADTVVYRLRCVRPRLRRRRRAARSPSSSRPLTVSSPSRLSSPTASSVSSSSSYHRRRRVHPSPSTLSRLRSFDVAGAVAGSSIVWAGRFGRFGRLESRRRLQIGVPPRIVSAIAEDSAHRFPIDGSRHGSGSSSTYATVFGILNPASRSRTNETSCSSSTSGAASLSSGPRPIRSRPVGSRLLRPDQLAPRRRLLRQARQTH